MDSALVRAEARIGSGVSAACNYIWVYITNKGAQCENSKTSTDMTTAVNQTSFKAIYLFI